MIFVASEIDKSTIKFLLDNLNKPIIELNVNSFIKQAIVRGTGQYKDHAVVILWRINQLIKHNKPKQAATLLVINANIFLSNTNSYITIILNKIYRKIIRRLFHDQNFLLLMQIMDINIGCEINTKMVCGFVYMLFNNKNKAKNIFLYVYNQSKNIFFKQQACYYLANLQDNIKDRNYWLNICTKGKICIWSLLAHIELGKSIKIQSIFKIEPLNYNGNNSDKFAKNIWYYTKEKNYKEAIKYVYSIHKNHWKEFSPTLINIIRNLVSYNQDKGSLYMIGNLMFRYHGFIIEECFPVKKELLYLYKNNKITKKEIVLSSAIIAMETKFFQHGHHGLLDNGKAVGVMQTAYREAKIMCENRGIPYNKDILIKNDLIGIIIGIDCIRYNNQFAKNNIVFMIYYYHSGHISHDIYNKFEFVDFDNMACLLGFIGLFEGNCARDYVMGVMEHFILYYRLIYQHLPTKHELINVE